MAGIKRELDHHDEGNHLKPSWTENLNNLVSAINGGTILFATDDGFAVAENMLKDNPIEFKEGVYTEYGKWMDGWETRRKRTPGHDWCIIKLGIPGTIVGFDVDTKHFIGNYPPRISILGGTLTPEQEAKLPPRRSYIGNEAYFDQVIAVDKMQTQNWTELVPTSELRPGTSETNHNYFVSADQTTRFTHLRLNLFPDGGVARLRVYGVPKVDWTSVLPSERIDLISLTNGGQCLGYSDAHYGHPRNLIAPGKGSSMAEGWETARRLDRPAVLTEDAEGNLVVTGSEWAVFRMGHAGIVNAVEIDTHTFKCNYPDTCKVEVCYAEPGSEEEVMKVQTGEPWVTILSPQKLLPNKPHYFSGAQMISAHEPANLARFTIYPDGGVSRFRLWGHIRSTEKHSG